MKYKDLLKLLIKDLDNNLERLDELQMQNIKSQQLEHSTSVRELTKGIEILKKHVVEQINKS